MHNSIQWFSMIIFATCNFNLLNRAARAKQYGLAELNEMKNFLAEIYMCQHLI